MIGPAADELGDADRLAGLVVDQVDRRLDHDGRLAVLHHVLGLERGADDLLRRHAVDLLGPGPHELDRAAGNDERLESIGPQVRQHFEHGLVDALGVRPVEPGMLCGGEPVETVVSNSVDRHAGVRGHQDLDQSLLARLREGLVIAFEHGLERLLLLPLRMFVGQSP